MNALNNLRFGNFDCVLDYCLISEALIDMVDSYPILQYTECEHSGLTS
jgi:hypothetical protein